MIIVTHKQQKIHQLLSAKIKMGHFCLLHRCAFFYSGFIIRKTTKTVIAFLSANIINGQLPTCYSIITNAISSAQSAQYTKKEDGNDAIFGKVLAVVHSDGMERVRREVASQQNKNRLMYDQIREKNEYFSYQLLPKIAVESNHHVLMREHGKLLQEEAFLFKELTKIQWMQRVSNTHEDAFNFLLQVWQRHEREAETAEERMDRLIKNVSYLKTNMKSACDNTGADHLAFSRNIILHSPEYIELSQRYQAINKKLEQSNNGVKKMDEEVGKLRSDNQCLRKENKELQTKLSYYQIKSKELLSKVAALTQDLIQQQRKSYQSQHTLTKRYESVEKWQNTPIFEISIKVNGETAPEGGNAIRRTACIAVERSLQEIVDFIEGAKDTSLEYSSVLSFQSNSLDVSEDKESTLSDIINDLQANEDQVPSYSSTKKAKHAKNRQLLFGHCNTASKELRFIRRK